MPIRDKQGIRAVGLRELKRMGKRPIYLLMLLLLPLLAFSFFWLFFNQGTPRELPVAIFDADHSALSHKITRMIEATPSMKIAEKVSSIHEGKRLLEDGECYALIVFPKEMENDAYSGVAPKVINYYNNLYMIAGSVISRDVRAVVGTVSVGIDANRRMKQGEMYDAAVVHIEPIMLKSEVLFNPYTSYQYFMTGSLNPAMLHIFVLILGIFALGIEFKEGTAKAWLECANGSTLKALAGKLLPYTVIFSILGLFMNTFHLYFLGAPQRGSFLIISIATIAFVLASQAVAVFIIALTANLRFSLSAGAFYSGAAFAFVGITFPQLAMPLVAKIWAALIPLNYYLKILIDQSMRGFSAMPSMGHLGSLCIFIVILPVLMLKRLNKLMLDGRFWGKI